MSQIRPIDRFVGALHRDQGTELLLESGRPVRVKTPRGERTILAQDVRTDQIENLVREVTPPDCARIFEDAGEVSFPYTAPTGAVMIHLLRRDRRLIVTVRPNVAGQRRHSPPPPTRPRDGMVMESAMDSVMGASRGVVTGMPAGRGPALARIAPVPVAMPPERQHPAAIQADLAAYVAAQEARPMELHLESFAPPPETVAQAEADIARRAGVRAEPIVEVRGLSGVDPRLAAARGPIIERSGTPAATVVAAAPQWGGPPPPSAREDMLHRSSGEGPAAGRIASFVEPTRHPQAAHSASGADMSPAIEATRYPAPIDMSRAIEATRHAEPLLHAVPSAGGRSSASSRVGPRASIHPSAAIAIEEALPPPPVRLVSLAPGDRRIDPILRALVEHKGSDLHLTSRLAPLYRKDGDIAPMPGFGEVLSSDTIHEWLMEVAPLSSREKFAAKNDADYAYEIPGVARFRVNAFRDRRGVGGVLRVIPSEILTADQLDLPPVVRELCKLDKGLVVVTGPTGSGKSTTLAAMVDLINKSRSDHVITIEDPVEFVHEPRRCLVNQREIHSHTESFSAALRAALREDPDIVLVGEMRDLETVSIAIETAETGHLVFGTLHTNTAVSTVDRIIDQFPTDRQAQVRVMLSESLRGVIAQTLCKKIGGGRVAALEILVGVPAVANMIREGKTFQVPSIMQTGKNVGMTTLNDSLMKLVREHVIEPSEALRRSVARADIRTALERAGHKLS